MRTVAASQADLGTTSMMQERMLADPAEEFVAFDLETTGLSIAEDRIVEVAAVRFRRDGAVVATFERLVNPLRPAGSMANAIHGIDEADLRRAEVAASVLPAFVAFLGDPARSMLVAHHAAFDAGVLGRELIGAGLALPGHRVVDTLAWARRVWPTLGTYQLGTLARRFGSEEVRSHRALADSHQARVLFHALDGDQAGGTDRPPLAYPIYDGAGPCPVPCGWEEVAAAIARRSDLRIEYLGGTHGRGPRDISPREFVHRGGVAYLVAWCHADRKLKQFQVDRVLAHRPIEADAPAPR